MHQSKLIQNKKPKVHQLQKPKKSIAKHHRTINLKDKLLHSELNRKTLAKDGHQPKNQWVAPNPRFRKQHLLINNHLKTFH